MAQKKIDLSAGIETPTIDLSAGLEDSTTKAPIRRPMLTFDQPAYSQASADSLTHPFSTKGYSPLDAPYDLMIGIEKGIGLDPMHPIRSAPAAAAGAIRGLLSLAGFYGPSQMYGAAKETATAAPTAIKKGGEAIRQGNLPEMFQSVGEARMAVAPFEAAVDVAKSASPGALRERARSASQYLAGSGTTRTVVPAVTRFTEDAASATRRQQAINRSTFENNRAAVDEAAAKNAANQAEHQVKAAEQSSGYRNAVSEALTGNREAAIAGSRVEGIERSIKEGSQKLGERVKDLDAKLRSEAAEKYDTVRKSVAEDPGVPLADLGEAARYAEANILKGSSESIKQFRELARKAPEEESVMSGGVEFPAGSRLYDMLQEQGAIDTGGNIPFDQLQGYSSEIGTKLAKGNLPGDVYQALKYVKEKIDTAKRVIADRNGAGATLRNADNFWRQYMDTFYDSDSAVAKVREGVGSVDPEFYADSFIKGKGGDVAIGRLKQLRTRHTEDASAVADLARNLRSANEQRSTVIVGKQKPIPEAPNPIPAPAEIVPKLKTPRQVEQPKPITEADLTTARRNRIMAKGASMLEFNKFRDAALVAAPVVAGLLGRDPLAGVIGGAALEGVSKGIGYALTRPRIVEWMSKPTTADIAALESLPEPMKVTVQAKLRTIINEERAAGRPVQIAPAILKIVGPVGAVQNRREALELIERR